MGKVLKVLVVILLLLNVGAAVLATMNHSKSELVRAREEKLRDTVTSIASFIEDTTKPAAEEGTEAPKATTLATELVGVDKELQTTSRSKLWESYNLALEETDRPKASISARDIKPETAAGISAMTAANNGLLEKAKAQMAQLTDTRIELKTLREEYVATIQELDKKNKDLAAAEETMSKNGVKLDELAGQIKPLQEDKETLEASLEKLQGTMDEQTGEMDKLTLKLTEANDEIAALKKKAAAAPVVEAVQTGAVQQVALHIEPGFKGRVAYFDPVWNFVVIELHEDFIKEVLGDDMNHKLPEGVELMIYRQGEKGAFVTKVHLTNIRVKEGVGVADVVPGWSDKKWYPVREGDGAFF